MAEGANPHSTSLLYHLRLLATREADGRLTTCCVQISTSTKGKWRPEYKAEEDGEENEGYEVRPEDEHHIPHTPTPYHTHPCYLLLTICDLP